MKVKGIIILLVQNFIKENFLNRYDEWLSKFGEEFRGIYLNLVMVLEWYLYQLGLIKLMELLVSMFYGNDFKKFLWKVGRFSVEVGLKGIYKVFVLIVIL